MKIKNQLDSASNWEVILIVMITVLEKIVILLITIFAKVICNCSHNINATNINIMS